MSSQAHLMWKKLQVGTVVYLAIQNETRNRVIKTNKYPRTNIWNFKNIQYTYIL